MLKSLFSVWSIYLNSIKKSLDSFVNLGIEFAKLDFLSSLIAILSFVPIFLLLFAFGQSLLTYLSQLFMLDDPSQFVNSLSSFIFSPLFIILLAIYGLILLAISPVFYSLSLYKYTLVDSKKIPFLWDYIKSNYVRFLTFGILSFAIALAIFIPSLLFAYAIPFVGFCIFFILIVLLFMWFTFAMPYAAINIALTNLSPLDSIKNALDLVKKAPSKTFFYVIFQFFTVLPFLALNFVFEFIWNVVYDALSASSPTIFAILDFFVLNLGSYLIMLPFAIFSVIFVYNIWKSIQK